MRDLDDFWIKLVLFGDTIDRDNFRISLGFPMLEDLVKTSHVFFEPFLEYGLRSSSLLYWEAKESYPCSTLPTRTQSPVYLCPCFSTMSS